MIQMNIAIQENGCQDDEVKILDTKLPYFYAHMQNLFVQTPENVEVVVVDSKEKFSAAKGEDTTEGAFVKDNKIFILEPHLFGVDTIVQRKDFYRTLYQELIYLFYQTNKVHN